MKDRSPDVHFEANLSNSSADIIILWGKLIAHIV